MYYDVEDLPREIGSRIWSTLIAPRPVFLITSLSEDGTTNIAPYNSVSCVSTFPPVVSVSFGTRRGEAKNTLSNIIETGTFSLNVVPRKLAKFANRSAEGTDMLDDFRRLGLTPRRFEVSPTLGIEQSPASIACELTQKFSIEGTQCVLIMARCMEVVIDDDFETDGLLDTVAAELIASIGVEEYITVRGDAFALPRLWE
jgi:flavin reductase (DIM6/NTAB) family NADH-FMN oxidoreductase RutF